MQENSIRNTFMLVAFHIVLVGITLYCVAGRGGLASSWPTNRDLPRFSDIWGLRVDKATLSLALFLLLHHFKVWLYMSK